MWSDGGAGMSRDGYLPPGVEEWMIPGNRPIDVAWDKTYEEECNKERCECYEVCKLIENENEGECKRLQELAEERLYGRH